MVHTNESRQQALLCKELFRRKEFVENSSDHLLSKLHKFSPHPVPIDRYSVLQTFKIIIRQYRVTRRSRYKYCPRLTVRRTIDTRSELDIVLDNVLQISTLIYVLEYVRLHSYILPYWQPIYYFPRYSPAVTHYPDLTNEWRDDNPGR